VKKATILVSMVIHAGFAFALLTASQHRASGKTYVVQLQEEAKKKKKGGSTQAQGAAQGGKGGYQAEGTKSLGCAQAHAGCGASCGTKVDGDHGSCRPRSP